MMWSLRAGQGCTTSYRHDLVRCGHIFHANTVQYRQCRGKRQSSGQAVAVHELHDAQYCALWDKFASKVQGEWEGVTVNFDATGAAQPLPERYVPGAYRDWGVELFDWQSQSSCLVPDTPTGQRSLRNIFKRLMPTVGCEADAIAYVEEVEDVWKADSGAPVKPVTAGGGYLAAPAQLPAGGGRVKLEVCLAAREGRSRLRATLALMQHWETKQWQVAFVELSRETYDGPFNGGAELSGCAGGGKPFAKDPVTTPEQLAGDWQASEVLTYARSESSGALELQSNTMASPERVATLAGPGAILLPLGVWVGCKAEKSDVLLEVGKLRSPTERDLLVCQYQGGRLEFVYHAREAK